MEPCYSGNKDQENEEQKQFTYAMEVEGSSMLPMVLKAIRNSRWLGEKVTKRVAWEGGYLQEQSRFGICGLLGQIGRW